MDHNAGSFDFSFKQKMRGMDYINLFKESGRVKRVLGPIVEGTMPGASIGGVCVISKSPTDRLEAEVVGFKDKVALLMPLDTTEGIKMGARIDHDGQSVQIQCNPEMVGALLNAKGEISIPGVTGRVHFTFPPETRQVKAPALNPTSRRSITERLNLGVRALDFTIPMGLGQRIAVMAASGVGKSILMGMIARQSKADINVIALIGERGREVTEFLERDLGPEGMKKSIVVSVTGDESPVLRVRGAFVATSIAEYFRDQGLNVLLVMDSVTRFGMALREIGLAAGEPPTTKGYTPSVFSQLPRLLERAGAKKNGGSITGIYTVLVEGNDLDDPIADHVRSIVDGHIVLSRELAAQNHYPAIDVLASVSRLNHAVSNHREQALNAEIRKILATYKEAEDLLNIGGYRKGNNPVWDRAIELYPKVKQFLQQGTMESQDFSEAFGQLEAIFRG